MSGRHLSPIRFWQQPLFVQRRRRNDRHRKSCRPIRDRSALSEWQHRLPVSPRQLRALRHRRRRPPANDPDEPDCRNRARFGVRHQLWRRPQALASKPGMAGSPRRPALSHGDRRHHVSWRLVDAERIRAHHRRFLRHFLIIAPPACRIPGAGHATSRREARSAVLTASVLWSNLLTLPLPSGGCPPTKSRRSSVVEQLIRNQQVGSSNLLAGSIRLKDSQGLASSLG